MTETQLFDTMFVAAQGQVSCGLGEDVMILSLQDGVYYGLDPVGARIWELLQERTTAADIRDALLDEFDVDPERCERDVVRLIRELLEARLIEVVPEDRR